jgi:hypothetical protein
MKSPSTPERLVDKNRGRASPFLRSPYNTPASRPEIVQDGPYLERSFPTLPLKTELSNAEGVTQQMKAKKAQIRKTRT